MVWNVDTKTRPGILLLKMSGRISDTEMVAFVAAHNNAVNSYDGHDYRVYVDIRGLAPLSPKAAEMLEVAKRYSATRPNFRGSAVLADSALASIQHQRTSATTDVLRTELISDDPAACEEYLEKVNRAD